MNEVIGTTTAPRRFSALLLGVFAAVALVLATLGIYSVISYSITLRTQEIGIRMALGARRPDILAAHARISVAVHGRDAAHADFYPNIDLAAAIGFQAVGLDKMFSGDGLVMSAGPALHLPVFDAGRIRAQYARATADLDLAVTDYNGAVLAAIKQTADAMTQVKSLEAQRVQQQDAVTSAEKAFQIAEDRYRSGLQTQLPMLTAEATLLQARQALAGVVAQGAQQRITLMLTVGGGFEPATPVAPLNAKTAAAATP